MNVDVLIIGQGISGTMLSWYLHQEKKSFVVVDDKKENIASLAAAGIMNPVTGRRYVTTWMADTVLPWAKKTYAEISDFFGSSLIHHKNIIDFFPTVQMQEAFISRLAEETPYLRSFPDQNMFNGHFQYEFGCGEICPSYIVNIAELIGRWRKFLIGKNSLMEEAFSPEQLQIKEENISYKGIKAEKIIFCDGINSMSNPWFHLLPFSANKGEALLIEAELPEDYIFKKSMVLAPLFEKNLFWFGAGYEWKFENDLPSPGFLNKSTFQLQEWLKTPFKILSHKAAIRPATIERRPFVGFHPVVPSVGILNGLGTKGVSLAPFFAHQLVQHLIHNFPLTEEADVQRFHRLLTK